MAPFSNKAAELLHEFGSAQVGAANASKLAKRPRGDTVPEGKIGDVHGHAVLVQGARDRGNDARYPTQDKNRTFQKLPYVLPKCQAGPTGDAG